MDTIVGLMFNRNEGDILEETITAVLPHVDSLFIADDGSTDNSWPIVQSMKGRSSKIEHIQRAPNPHDRGQKQALLNEIRRRYKPENTWVQVCESDIMILDTNVHDAIKRYNRGGVLVDWLLLNGVRKPGAWGALDEYPKWNDSIKNILPYAHIMETMTYTFRPLPDIGFSSVWRPWPSGFGRYLSNAKEPVMDRWRPLLMHYGYRGPTHFHLKYKSMGATHTKHKAWKLGSPQEVEQTVPFFSGEYNKHSFPASRWGLINSKKI